jgi:hypothetical protein
VVVLHGAFGELAKIRELRDLHVDAAILADGPRGLTDALWPRYAAGYARRLEVLAPELRRAVEPEALRELRRKVDALPAELGVADRLQALYLDENLRATRYGHWLWNQRLPTRFPFLQPDFVDLLLQVRNEDRTDPRFQVSFLQDVHPALARLPDENTGLAIDSSRLRRETARLIDRGRALLRRSGAHAGHSDLIEWVARTEPPAEELVAAARGSGLYDVARLERAVHHLRAYAGGRGPRSALARRRAHGEAVCLQAFFWLEASRRRLGWTPA